MEKLKRLQAGEDVEDLLAEIDEEMPSGEEDEGEQDPDTVGLTEVQKKVSRGRWGEHAIFIIIYILEQSRITRIIWNVKIVLAFTLSGFK